MRNWRESSILQRMYKKKVNFNQTTTRNNPIKLCVRQIF